jgi:hypothetical protein
MAKSSIFVKLPLVATSLLTGSHTLRRGRKGVGQVLLMAFGTVLALAFVRQASFSRRKLNRQQDASRFQLALIFYLCRNYKDSRI